MPRWWSVELTRRPDALNVLHVRVGQAADCLVLDEVLDTRECVMVLADPHDRPCVLRRLRLLRRRLNLPARGAVNGIVSEQLIVIVADVALFEVLEAEIGAEESGRSILER